jgi:hypothetical protein
MTRDQDQGELFGETVRVVDADAVLIDAYARVGRTLDDLPYTAEFEALYAAVGGGGCGLSRAEVVRKLQNLRKAGKLPRLGRTDSPAIKANEEEDALLRSLVEREAGSIGQRDGLLYTENFDSVVHDFNARSGRQLSAHDVWRLVAKLAK